MHNTAAADHVAWRLSETFETGLQPSDIKDFVMLMPGR